MSGRRLLVVAAAVGGVVAVLLATLAIASRKAPAAAERPPEDEIWISPDHFAAGLAAVAVARPADLPRPLVLPGHIDFDDMHVAHVFSPVSGRVTRILVRLGQSVRRGTPLADIVSPDVGSALSDEVKARADLTAAEHDWVRQQKLFAVKAAAERDYESARDTYERARAEEARAGERARLLARGRVNAVTQELGLESPIAGRVIARMVNPGMEVQGQFAGGTALELFTVGETASVWLYADVPEADLRTLRPGAAVEARVLAWPGRAFAGRVDWVSPVLDPQLRTGRIRCALPNPGGLLKPQMLALVAVERPPVHGLAVPRSAVVRINEQSFVYVATGARRAGKLVFQRRMVQTPTRAGAVSRQQPPADALALLPVEPAGSLAQILSGVSAGESVLVEGLPGTQNGHGADAQTVEISRQQMASGRIAVEPVAAPLVADVVEVSGRLAFDELRVAHVFPPLGGVISRVIAAPGQIVRRGAPLAVIDSAELGSASADMLKAKADLAAAEQEAKRQRELTALKVGVPRDLEAALDNYDRAKAEYERAEQRTGLLRGGGGGGGDGVSQSFVLRSPLDGEVTARQASPGLQVQGQYDGGGNVVELYTVGQTDPLWLLGDLFEIDLPYVRVGDPMVVEVPAWPGRTFGGFVDWISDVLDPVQHTAKVRCVLANHEHLLRPEMAGMARLAMPMRRCLSVPREALLRLGDQTVVFLARGETADGHFLFQRRPVRAREDVPGGRVPILAGLQPGDRVASRGAIFLAGAL